MSYLSYPKFYLLCLLLLRTVDLTVDIRELSCIRPYLDLKTASTIATSIVQSKLDYYKSMYHYLSNCQLNWLQQIQNSLARAVLKAPKSTQQQQQQIYFQ